MNYDKVDQKTRIFSRVEVVSEDSPHDGEMQTRTFIRASHKKLVLVDEVQSARHELERGIQALLKAYEAATGLRPVIKELCTSFDVTVIVEV